MRRTAFWGLSLLLVLAFAPWASAQDIKWKGTADYEGYMAAYNENDLAKKAANAEKFLATFKDADPLATQQIYMMLIKSYYGSGNFAKALDAADKQATTAPNISAADKKQVLLIGMDSATRVRNTAKIESYARGVLAADPKEVNALVTLSGLLGDPSTLPRDEAPKAKRFEETLTITKRALAEPMPAGTQVQQWNGVKVQLHDTTCMVLLNQKKYDDAIAACAEALKLNKKDGYAYYLTGLAMKPAVASAIANYTAAVDKLNQNRTADQLTRDDLKATADGLDVAATAKVDELIEVFAKSVATGWSGASNARAELKIFKGTPEELERLIAAKKAELGVGSAN